MRYRLVVAANRLPIRRTPAGGWAESSGGLVSAVGSVLSGSREAAWVGWDGSVGGGPLAPPRHPVDLHGVSLTAAEVEGFYEGFSNRTLWPLYHDRIRPPEIRESWWDRYVEVNGRYAARLAGLLAPGGTAWVHDYHLHLVPGMLRRLRPDARIGFFLHIPFPPPEVFLQLPWRREVAEGLLGADLVGFQTPLAASNFRRVVRWLGLGRPAGPRLDARRHHIEVRPFPISIDVAAFETLSSDPATGAAARGLRRSWGEPAKVLLGVDRLDTIRRESRVACVPSPGSWNALAGGTWSWCRWRFPLVRGSRPTGGIGRRSRGWWRRSTGDGPTEATDRSSLWTAPWTGPSSWPTTGPPTSCASRLFGTG